MGAELIAFSCKDREGIDSMLTRWDMARSRTASVGAAIENFHLLSTLLLRHLRLSDDQALRLLAPTNNRMPQNQEQYDALVFAGRQVGHVVERHNGNICRL